MATHNSCKESVEILSNLSATVLYIAERYPVVFNIAAGNIYGIASYIHVSLRTLDSSVKLQKRLRLNTETTMEEAKSIMAEIYSLFDGCPMVKNVQSQDCLV
jgi:hypothetical protein